MTNTIALTENFVKNIHQHDSSGHDYSHIERVRKMALKLAAEEHADLFIVEMAALLHDTVDDKLTDETAAWQRLEKFMTEVELTPSQQQAVTHILKYMSFKGGSNTGLLKSLEGQIVQDADRLDALGAVGIARTFMFAGKFGDVMYDPEFPPRNLSKVEYRDQSTAINHFYEKLFKLEHMMNTDTARCIARQRTAFMEQFIEQFKTEWHQ